MEAQPFRTIVPAEAPSVTQGQPQQADVRTVDTKDSVEPGLSLYAEIKGHPYTAEHFSLGLLYQDMPEVRADVHAVDEFMQQQVKDKGLENTTAAYREMLGELDKEIGSYENELPLQHFRRIAAAVRALNRLKEAHTKPVLSMSALTPQEYDSTRSAAEAIRGHYAR